MEGCDNLDKFIKTIFPDTKDGKILLWRMYDKTSAFVNNAEEAIIKLQGLQNKNDIYMGCCLSDKNYGRKMRCSAENVYAIPGVWADIDIANDIAHKKGNLPKTADEALKIISATEIEPTIIIHSGYGLQAWWLFDDLWVFNDQTERQEAMSLSQMWNSKLIQIGMNFGYEVDSTHDLARVMRIPGTYNAKDENNFKEVTVFSQTNKRYAIDEIKDRCKNISVINTAEYTNTGKCNYKVDANAEPPFDKYTALCKKSKRFVKACERKLTDINDTSKSGHEASMVWFMVEADFSEQEIVNTLIAVRRNNNEEFPNNSYYGRTIAKIRATIEEKKKTKADEFDVVLNTNQDKLNFINNKLFINISKIIKYKSEPPQYAIIMEDGSNARIGDVDGLIRQRAFTKHIASVCGRYIPSIKKDAWNKIAQLLLDICELVDVGEEATESGYIAETISDYLQATNIYTDVQSAAEKNKPFYDCVNGEEHIFFSGKDFRNWISLNSYDKITNIQMGILFRMIGIEQACHRVNKTQTKKLWRISHSSPIYIREKNTPSDFLVG